MKSIKNIFLMAFITLSATVFAQEDKYLIIASFDKIEYYSDSTIKCVYTVKKGVSHGYSIEFDSTGTAIRIGKYKRGFKHGNWYWNNGWLTQYKKGKSGLILIPGCRTGLKKAHQSFIELYNELIGK